MKHFSRSRAANVDTGHRVNGHNDGRLLEGKAGLQPRNCSASLSIQLFCVSIEIRQRENRHRR